ncbi:hypothetical protein HJG60_011218 [Phyllostomus discolor]|uniref:Uncharacterized protein n=1 Tax=Phyllostomus discolor TaxID=89673 RepID=A0A834E593_9CHIR|nr:hypothetical protein HJG60_011218 [Phyllostomus discolor]
MGVNGTPTHPLSLVSLKAKSLKHSFLIIPQCPIPLLEKNLLARLETILKLQEASYKVLIIMLACKDKKENNIPKQILQKINPLVWNPGVPGQASTAQPVQICLKPAPVSEKWSAQFVGNIQVCFTRTPGSPD